MRNREHKHVGPLGGKRNDLDELFPGAHVLAFRVQEMGGTTRVR